MFDTDLILSNSSYKIIWKMKLNDMTIKSKLCNKEISGVICAYKIPSIFPAVLSTMNSYQTLPSILQVCAKRTIFIGIIIGTNICVGLKNTSLYLFGDLRDLFVGLKKR